MSATEEDLQSKLKAFYGLEGSAPITTSSVEAPRPARTGGSLDGRSSSHKSLETPLDAHATFQRMRQTLSLEQLVAEAAKAGMAVRTADSELQMLLHDNYRSLFTAMSGLSAMAEEAQAAKSKISHVSDTFDRVTEYRNSLNNELRPQFIDLQKQLQRQQLCQKLSELAALPRKVQTLLAHNNPSEALEFILSVDVLLREDIGIEGSQPLQDFLTAILELGRVATEGVLAGITNYKDQFPVLLGPSRTLEAEIVRGSKAAPLQALTDAQWPHRMLSDVGRSFLAEQIRLISRARVLPSVSRDVANAATEAVATCLAANLVYLLAPNADAFPQGDPPRFAFIKLLGVCQAALAEGYALNDILQENLVNAPSDAGQKIADAVYVTIKDFISSSLLGQPADSALEETLWTIHECLIVVESSVEASREEIIGLLSYKAMENCVLANIQEPFASLRAVQAGETVLSEMKVESIVHEQVITLQNHAITLASLITKIGGPRVAELLKHLFAWSALVPISLSVAVEALIDNEDPLVVLEKIVYQTAATESMAGSAPSPLMDQIALEILLQALHQVVSTIDVRGGRQESYAISLMMLLEGFLTKTLKSLQQTARRYQVPWNDAQAVNLCQDGMRKLQDFMVKTAGAKLGGTLEICLSSDVLSVYATAGEYDMRSSLEPCVAFVEEYLALLHQPRASKECEMVCNETIRVTLESCMANPESTRLHVNLRPMSSLMDSWTRQGSARVWQAKFLFAFIVSSLLRFLERLGGVEQPPPETGRERWSEDYLLLMTSSLLYLMAKLARVVSGTPALAGRRAQLYAEYITGWIWQVVSTHCPVTIDWTEWVQGRRESLLRSVELEMVNDI